MDRSDAMALAQLWWSNIADTVYLPMTSTRARNLLADLVTDLDAAVHAEPFTTAPARTAGAALFIARATDPVVVTRSAEILAQLPVAAHPDGPQRLVTLIGAFGEGFATQLQKATLTGQEQIHGAMAAARRHAEAAQRSSGARFRAVFDNAMLAIAIVDSRGHLIDANPALTAVFGTTSERLRGMSMVDEFLHADDHAEVRRFLDDVARSDTTPPTR